MIRLLAIVLCCSLVAYGIVGFYRDLIVSKSTVSLNLKSVPVLRLSKARKASVKGFRRERVEAKPESFLDLGGKDPDRAFAAAMELPEGDERNKVLESVCFGLAKNDPAEAVEMAERYGLEKQPGTMENLVYQWAFSDLSSAFSWATNRPDGEQREQYISRIAYVLAQRSPSDAARFVVEQIPPGLTQTEAAMMVVHQWALRDAAGAASWVESFPEGPIRDRAINELKGLARLQAGK
jgi:hypothetical protein